MSRPNVILSTCGTSLFTNGRSNEERGLVNKYSNVKKREELAPEIRRQLEGLIDDVRQKVESANLHDITRMSAELNALVRFYQYRPFPKQDAHVLLCTDTWLGEEAARIVEQYLRRQGCQQVEVHRQKDLQTADLESFQLALSDLVKWIDEDFSVRYRGYYTIFNLTGGFKSVQGFLQSLAPFYADEIIYIFESGEALLRIPRLPVRMAAGETVREHITTIRRLSLGLPTPEAEVRKLPETLVMRVNGGAILAPLGEAFWRNVKRELYKERLYPSPVERIVFSSTFERDVKALPPDRLALVNERIDDLANYLRTGHNPKSLDFKQLQGNPHPPSTHECDAWSDRDARRIFAHFEGDRLVLDALEKGLH